MLAVEVRLECDLTPVVECRPMSIEVLKRELSALDPGTQRQVMTYLVSLADKREVAFRFDFRRKLTETPIASVAEANRLAESDRHLKF